VNAIDRRSPLPLYYQLKEILIEELNAGVYPAGSVLPPEMNLVQSYNLSRATVRRAMQELEYEGYISRTPGRGTIVLREKSALNRGLSQLTSFTEDMKAHGYEATARILDYETAPAPAAIAKLLRIPADTPVIHVTRLRYVQQLPVAINDSYIHMPQGTCMNREELERAGSLYRLFETKRIPLLEADKTIEAIAADAEKARLLGVPPGAPLLQVEGVVCTLNDQPLEYHRVISRSDMYKYALHLLR
jgi:GntR family transcriptional regulator